MEVDVASLRREWEAELSQTMHYNEELQSVARSMQQQAWAPSSDFSEAKKALIKVISSTNKYFEDYATVAAKHEDLKAILAAKHAAMKAVCDDVKLQLERYRNTAEQARTLKEKQNKVRVEIEAKKKAIADFRAEFANALNYKQVALKLQSDVTGIVDVAVSKERDQVDFVYLRGEKESVEKMDRHESVEANWYMLAKKMQFDVEAAGVGLARAECGWLRSRSAHALRAAAPPEEYCEVPRPLGADFELIL